MFRMLCIIDEFTRECLAIRVERRLNSRDVLDELGELFVRHGPPEHIRSDNGPEFIATALREWLGRLGTKTLYIEPVFKRTVRANTLQSWDYCSLQIAVRETIVSV